MAKRQGRSQGPSNQDHGVSPPPKRGGDALGLATLVGVVAVLVISFSNWREIDRLQTNLDNRLDEIESKIGQGSTGAAAPQRARRGPDPNRVYSIKTAGSPSKGPQRAPVTIAEFSDFQ